METVIFDTYKASLSINRKAVQLEFHIASSWTWACARPLPLLIMSILYLTKEEEQRYAELQMMGLDSARRGDTSLLESMLQAGLPVNLSDEKGNSLLMLAAYNGNPETVAMLLHYKADTERRNNHGQTALGGVAFKGNLAIAKLLVEAGADVDADNGGGKTPLMFAAMFGHRESVQFLIEAGADQNSQTILGLSVTKVASLTGALRSLSTIPLFSKGIKSHDNPQEQDPLSDSHPVAQK